MITIRTTTGSRYLYDVSADGQPVVTRLSENPLLDRYDQAHPDVLNAEPLRGWTPPQVGRSWHFITQNGLRVDTSPVVEVIHPVAERRWHPQTDIPTVEV